MTRNIFGTLRKKIPLTLAVIAVLFSAGVILADDDEDPVTPTSTPPGDSAFGSLLVSASDVWGLTIDAKEAVEPQTTALLAMGDLNGCSSGAVVVSSQPAFESWEPYSQ